MLNPIKIYYPTTKAPEFAKVVRRLSDDKEGKKYI